MPFQELFDETIDINSTENYELFIQVSLEGIAFCILDSIRNKYILFRSFDTGSDNNLIALKLDELFRKDDFLSRKYKKIAIITPTEKSTIVPAQLYDPAKKNDYFHFNHSIENDSVLLVNKMTDPEAYIIFGIPKSIHEITLNRYANITPIHHIKPLLSHVYHAGKGFRGDYVHLHIEKDFFSLLILNSNTLKFCNSFNYKTTNDILYYVLNTLKVCEISQETNIFLSGFVEKQDDLISIFSSYIKNLTFSHPSGNFTFSYIFNDSALRQYINLFNLPNCV